MLNAAVEWIEISERIWGVSAIQLIARLLTPFVPTTMSIDIGHEAEGHKKGVQVT